MPENEDVDKELDEGPEEENEAGGSLREIEKEEDDELLPPRKSNKALIAGLSVVIFLALFVFFKGEEAPNPDNDIDIQIPSTENMESTSEEIFDDAPLVSEPNAGEIIIAGEEDEVIPEVVDESIVPITKEELAFFDPLSDTESDREPSESEALALVKAEIPKPVLVKPALPKPSPKPKPASIAKPKAVKSRKSFTDVFTIQLGAFKGRSGADKLDDRLRNSGYDSFVLVMPNDVYRVRVGSFKTRKAAKQMADKIKKREQLDSFITTE